MLVLLDTNFIVACMENKVKLREQLERQGPTIKFTVLGRVIEEIDFLPIKERKLARLFLASYKPELVPAVGVTDDQLISHAKKSGSAVATLDSGLKKRLKREGGPIITLAQTRGVFSEDSDG